MKQPQDLRRFESLQQILHMLRSPEGCPWDRAQTHKSMRDSLLEETYEVGSLGRRRHRAFLR